LVGTAGWGGMLSAASPLLQYVGRASGYRNRQNVDNPLTCTCIVACDIRYSMFCEEGNCGVDVRGIKSAAHFYFRAQLNLSLNPISNSRPRCFVIFIEILIEYFCM
jgi:hypothetical protein